MADNFNELDVPIGTGADHSSLANLGADDHTQYLTAAEGDAAYYTQTQLDAGQLDSQYRLAEAAGPTNLLINGNFDIWQRGSTFTSAATGYHADRFSLNQVGSAVVDVTRSTDTPNAASQYSMKTTVTTALASPGAGDYLIHRQRVQGSMSKDLQFGTASAKTVTISFYVKATVTGTYSIVLRNKAGNRNYAADYTVDTTATWEKKTITVPGDITGTWDVDNGVGLQVYFALAAGSSGVITPGSWTASSGVASSNQVNALASINNEFYLSQVQVEASSVATPFITKSINEEINACQYYYYKTYNLDVVPGSSPTNVGEIGFRQSGPNIVASLDFPRMRATPTATLYSPNDGSTGNAYDYNAATNVVASTQALGETGIVVVLNGTDQNHVAVHLTVDAEL